VLHLASCCSFWTGLLERGVRMNPAKLRRILLSSFNESELRDLCFDLRVDYDNLPGQSKADKARELVAYFDRRGRIAELIKVCYQLRPNASWRADSKRAERP
jgi:hypothetical protein